MQIRSKLTLQFISITAAIFIIALYFIYLQFKQHLENEHFNVLESKALMTAEMVLRDEEKLKPILNTNPKENQNSTLPLAGNTAIYNDKYECVFRLNHQVPTTDPQLLRQVKQNGELKFNEHGLQSVGISTNSNRNNEFLVIASDVPDYSKLDELRNILFFSFIIIIIAVAGGGWFFAKQSLSPVEAIVTEVEKILPSNLNKRLAITSQGDELSHLVNTFNKLLERIEEAFHLQKSFISNVSHEIKNPIASIDAQIQLAKTKFKEPNETTKLLDSIHEDIIEINETNDKLLQLSKFYSDKSSVDFKQVRLDEVIFSAMDALVKMEKDYKVKIDFVEMPEDDNKLIVKGNEFLLKSAIYNLLENGCKFSNDHLVRIVLDFSVRDYILLRIENESMEITKLDMDKLFEPFYRSISHNHIKGSGLGLSIVKSIIDLHHFTIQSKQCEDHLMCFIIKMPYELTNFNNGSV